MRAALWLALGGAVAAGAALLLRSKRATAAPAPEPTYGETTRVALAVPAGWRRATSAEVAALPELAAAANALRSSPDFVGMSYGTLIPFVASDGRTYATWIEQHYHEPGGALRPWGLHHGVTLLARAT